MAPGFLEQRTADLLTAGRFCKQLLAPGAAAPSEDQLTGSVLLTAASSLILAQAGLILITGVGRKQLLIGAETVLASFLLLCLILLVLSLPLGAPSLHWRVTCALVLSTRATHGCLPAGVLYLGYKATAVLLGSLFGLDAFAGLRASMHSHLPSVLRT